MKRKPWTSEQDALLRARYPHEKTERLVEALGHSIASIYQRAANLGLRKTPAFLASPDARRLDGKIGAAGRLKKGHVPWNKGMKGLQMGGVATQFKPGHRGGKAVDLYQPIGAERISKDGYLQRKINDDMPLQKRWRGVHILVWEAANGPLPAGHAVTFKDGNKSNITLDNLELLTRAQLMARNTIHNLPEELRDVIRLNGVIRRKINGTRHQ
ncbi:bacteriophage phi 1.45 protein-like protein [Sulfuriferula multivorans]|uniref:Bacteriophage phi 1.45 protein-like protein n=1 Tax=Sulfuriferula multivorans TaxID=1559896 RepID=A0A401JF32_9PROT|nr:HNH endonuclease signature motif containing protein [Sulfuriferula multivorans]GBL46247.1 bacteriophage phi 1.45 protein-like protein [Sulfuriferula multivorans]